MTGFTAEELGFRQVEPPPVGPEGRGGCWTKLTGDRLLRFRVLRDLADLAAVETVQREVFAGVSDLDVAGPGMLVVVAETGGEVLGAYQSGTAGEELLGFVVGWGGFVAGRPRIISDMLAVRAAARGGGVGAELKKLQAALALARGFVEIVWTVDPLRAANARLNFEKLGAFCDRYEIDRYGAAFAPGLYGGLPTDRLHLTWPIADPAIRDRLLGRVAPRAWTEVAPLPSFDPGAGAWPDQVRVEVPPDVDRLVAPDPAAAGDWRLRVRAALTTAFAAGFAIVGFAAAPGAERAALVLARRAAGR